MTATPNPPDQRRWLAEVADNTLLAALVARDLDKTVAADLVRRRHAVDGVEAILAVVS